MSANGSIHVYYGDGKGKTTAALGLALRAAGFENNIVIVQFLKNWVCGEHISLKHLPNIVLYQAKSVSGKFVSDMTDDEKLETKVSQDECLKNALKLVESGRCDMLILDEAIDAYMLGVLDSELLKGLIINKPESLELVVTGHNPDAWFLERAAYVTEMKKHKHPYDVGMKARRGIEF
ncbi:MAG: cob(I)yrinic acid a,c-diamide adenosyltransferase [Oscillospiraceae bacterium]|jgi:cob(I)alamin adenosyltransferase|nr:cob(I)yrinic acid a,c-diamide adenosyltransferase [Oscillospiraceae bacterium]